MNERDLEYFSVIAQQGHLGRAAEALGLSQPALSVSLRRLERSMQVKLVKRTPKGVELTDVGEALLGHLLPLRLARESVAREVADLSQGRAGDVRVAAQPGSPEDLVARAAGILLKDVRKTMLRVTVSTFDVAVPGLRNGEFDLLVGSTPSAPADDLACEPLLDDVYVVYASSRHQLARRKRIALADLVEERWVRTASAGPSWRGLNQAFEQRGLPHPRFAMESNSLSVRRLAVATGGLLGYGSRRRLLLDARRYSLVALPVRDLLTIRRIVVSYRKDGYLSPASRRFIEILKVTGKDFATSKPRDGE